MTYANNEASAIAALVVNYFSHASISDLIESIALHQGDSRIIISIVDNSQDTREYAALEALARAHESPRLAICLTDSTSNLGYAGGNGAAWVAISAFHAEIATIFVINPDIRVIAGRLDHLSAAVAALPNSVFSVKTHSGGEVLSGQGVLEKATGRSRQAVLDSPPTRGVVYGGGHFLAMSKSLWSQLGGLSDQYFLYCEEIDLILRLASNGEDNPISTSNLVTVEHAGGLTTGSEISRGRKSEITHFHSSRSRVLLYRRHQAVRPYIIPMAATRVAWAVLVSFRETPRNGVAVLKGMIAGFVYDPVTPR